MSGEVAGALIGAGGAIVGAGVGGVVTLRATLPYRKQAALQRSAALVARRYECYRDAVAWMAPYRDDASEPVAVPFAVRRADAARLRSWYYEGGGALLMSGDAFNAYMSASAALLDERADAGRVAGALSALRTELKIDLGAREPLERDAPLAPSAERRY